MTARAEKLKALAPPQTPFLLTQPGSAAVRKPGSGPRGGHRAKWPDNLKAQFPRPAEAVTAP